MITVASRYSVRSKIDYFDAGIELSSVPDALKKESPYFGGQSYYTDEMMYGIGNYFICILPSKPIHPFRYHTAGDITLIIYLE